MSHSTASCNPLLRRRLLPALVTIVLASACVPGSEIQVDITATAYNDKPVSDTSGSNGTIGDPRYGPYLDGVTNDPEGCVGRGTCREAVSLLQPDLEQAGQEALVKSDCYWAPIQGETLMVTWEAVLTLDAASARLSCDSPTTVGTCRLRNPQTGDPLELYLDEPCDPSGAQPVMTVTAAADIFPLGAAAIPSDRPYELDVPEDFATHLATFGGATLPGSFEDPYGRCPAPSDYTGPPPEPTLGSRCSSEAGRFATCARRCGLLNPEEAVYLVSIGGISPDLTLSPALRIVPRAGRKIARRMTHAGGNTFRWQTPVEGGECGLDAMQGNSPASKKFYRCRWHENFSPSVQVEAVRIFALEGDDERPVDLEELVLRWKDPPDGGDVTEWRCPLDDVPGEAVIGNFVASCIRATPTYPVDSHANALSQAEPVPITAPLEWIVDFGDGQPPAADLYLELSLRNRTGEALLAVDPSLDLGRTRMGGKSSGTLWIRNIGSAEARIDGVVVTGPDGADFRHRVLAAPLPEVEVPLEIAVGAGGSTTVTVGRTAADLLPLVESVDRSVAPQLRLLSPFEMVTQPLAGPSSTAAHSLPAGSGAAPDVAAAGPSGVASADPTALPPTTISADPVAGRPDVTTTSSTGTGPPASMPAARPHMRDFVEHAGESLINLRLPPFTIAVGEEVQVVVEMSPSQYGRRRATLRFDGVDATRPTRALRVESVLHGWGLGGPRLHPFPEGVLDLPYPLTPRSPERSLLLINSGDMRARRTGIAITGPDADRFAVTSDHRAVREIAPGDSEHFLVRLSSPCAPLAAAGAHAAAPLIRQEWNANLELATDEGTLTVPLRGRPIDCFR